MSRAIRGSRHLNDAGGRASGLSVRQEPRRLGPEGHRRLVPDSGNPGLKYVVLVGGDDDDPVLPIPRRGAPRARVRLQRRAHQRRRASRGQPAASTTSWARTRMARRSAVTQDATSFPVPDLAVGRLVETAAEATTVLDAYLAHDERRRVPRPARSSPATTSWPMRPTPSEMTSRPGRPTGAGPADRTEQHLATRILRRGRRPSSTRQLLGTRARPGVPRPATSPPRAPWPPISPRRSRRRIWRASPTDFTNTIVFSAGLPFRLQRRRSRRHAAVTEPARLGPGVRPQGRDADRRYGLPVRRHRLRHVQRADLRGLRPRATARHGPVSVGDALLRAKQDYLQETPTLRGIDTKALLESTLFGLPMLSVNLPAADDSPIRTIRRSSRDARPRGPRP